MEKLINRSGMLRLAAVVAALGLSSAAGATIMYSAGSSGTLTIDVLPAAITASFAVDNLDGDQFEAAPPGTASGSFGSSSDFAPGTANSSGLVVGDSVVATAQASGNAADGGSVDSFGEGSTLLILSNGSAADLSVSLILDYFVFASAMVSSAANEDAAASAALSVESLSSGTVLFDFFAQVDTLIDGMSAQDGSNIPTSVAFNIVVPANSIEQLNVFSTADGEGFSAVLAVAPVPLPGSLILVALGGLLIQRRQQRS